MRVRRIGVAVVTLGITFGSFVATSSSAEPASGSTYLVLGDSLAASFQPNGELHSGYAEQVLQLEQASLPDLRLVKLACPGERTSTIDRSRRLCPYDEGTQLDQAVAALGRGNVAFVTLQIGSNDLFRCFSFRDAAFDQTCVDALLPKISARLTSIVQTLQAAAGPDVPIVGGNYYDPLLAAWTIPGLDHDAVVAIADVWTSFNDMLEATYAALGVPVADIESAFSATDFATVVHARGLGDLPINVARACQWTFACSAEFDPHANTIGYAVMARAWETAIDAALAPAP
jgi:lysophospholipase L1-like esterase